CADDNVACAASTFPPCSSALALSVAIRDCRSSNWPAYVFNAAETTSHACDLVSNRGGRSSLTLSRYVSASSPRNSPVSNDRTSDDAVDASAPNVPHTDADPRIDPGSPPREKESLMPPHRLNDSLLGQKALSGASFGCPGAPTPDGGPPDSRSQLDCRAPRT